MALAIRYRLKDLGAETMFHEIERQLKNPKPALSKIGLVIVRSVTKNFKAGGRPVRWTPSRRVRAEGGQTLVDTGRLVRSISKRVRVKTLTVGTNVEYAALHHFGGDVKKNVTVKQHWRYMDTAFGRKIPARHVVVRRHERLMNLHMPARPFMLVQESDFAVIEKILIKHVVNQ